MKVPLIRKGFTVRAENHVIQVLHVNENFRVVD
jgi:hypothetical protein